MKQFILFFVALNFLTSAWADDEMVTLIDSTPSQFGKDFNRLNQSVGKGVYRNIHLENQYGERVLNLAPNINLTVGAHEDGIEYIDLVCDKPKSTVTKCVGSLHWIGTAVDPNFNQMAFLSMVTDSIDAGVSVGYRQNDIEYHVIADKKRNQLRMEIQALD